MIWLGRNKQKMMSATILYSRHNWIYSGGGGLTSSSSVVILYKFWMISTNFDDDDEQRPIFKPEAKN